MPPRTALCRCEICLTKDQTGCNVSHSTRVRHEREEHRRKLHVANQKAEDTSKKGVLCKCPLCIVASSGAGKTFTAQGLKKHKQRVQVLGRVVGTDIPSIEPVVISANNEAVENEECMFGNQLDYLNIHGVDDKDSEEEYDSEAEHFVAPTEDHAEQLSLDDQLLNTLLLLQVTLDLHAASASLQDELFNILFKGENCIVRLASRRKKWDGKLNGLKVPTSVRTMKTLLKELGLPDLERQV